MAQVHVKSQPELPPVPPELQFVCGNDESEGQGDSQYMNGENCQNLGSAQFEYLPLLPYIPTSDDPVLLINVNLLFIAREDNTASFIDIPEHIQLWEDIEYQLNKIYSSLQEPSYTGDNATCEDPYASFVSNSKIQFSLNPVFLKSDTYNDLGLCWASDVRNVLQPFLDAEVPELRCNNSINVAMSTDSLSLANVLNGGDPISSGCPANATFPSFNNLSEVGFTHIRNLFVRYMWMKTVIPETSEYPHPWEPVIRYWFVDTWARGLAHELGHNIGLYHDNAVHGINTCKNSIMNQAGQGVRNFLPPTEVGKIHRALAHSSVRNAVDVSSYSDVPITIDTDTEWNTDRKIYRPIVVEDGATLTVTCKVLFHPDASLIVKPGGTLIVDGGTLTNYCDELWQGVQVWGKSDKHQYTYASNKYYQGRAIFKNDALLENAREGVVNWKPDHYDQTGGIIQASNSTFKNCRRVVAFYSYQNTSPTNSNVKRPDQSYFDLCEFIIDDDYLRDQDVKPPYAIATLWKTDRVKFRGCEFNNTATVSYSENRTRAIYSIDANYMVQEYCDDIYPSPTTCQGTETYSKFTGWHKAIEATGSVEATRPISVRKSIFKENMIGIEIAGAEYSEIYKNEFQMGDHPLEYYDENNHDNLVRLGVYMNSTLHFSIEENNFKRLASAAHDGHGVLVYNSKGSNNEVYKNDFKNLNVGANGWQINKNVNFEGGVPAGQAGLQFICNTNSNNTVDFEISRSGSSPDYGYLNAGIRQNQGSGNPQRPAGNTFSTPSSDPNVYTHFTISSTDIYGYFYRNNPPYDFTPGKMVVQPQLTVSESCPSNYSGGVVVGPTGLLGKIDEYNGLLYTYHQTIDDGNTPGAIIEVEHTWPQDAWELRDILIGRSPYVSEEVLIAAAMREIMPHAMLLEVLLANPDALRNGNVIRKIEEGLINPMPEYMIDLLWASRDEKTFRTSMENTLAELHYEVIKEQRQIIRSRVFDNDNSYEVDSLLYYIGLVKTVEANYARVAAFADENNFSSAIALLDSMLINYRLETPQYNECNLLKSFYTIIQSSVSQGVTVANLPQSSINSLQSLALSPDAGLAGVKARNLLCFHYDICFGSDGLQKSMDVPEKPKPSKKELLSKINTSNAFPNPARDYITISYTLLSAVENSEMLIFDGLGRHIESRLIGKVYEGHELIDSRKMPNGIYLYQILQDGNKILEGKFVVTK